MKKPLALLLFMSLIIMSCVDSPTVNSQSDALQKLQVENDSLNNILIQNKAPMKNEIISFLTFQDNNAENAMNFYVELFDNSKVVEVQRWGKGAPGEEGKIMMATFDLNGKLFKCSDSPPVHDWDFSPAISNYLDCENESELERLFSKLSENGTVTMPLNNYGFSKKFGWVIDQFGVSWQLNLS